MPLDSWVYDAFKRLAAWGYEDNAYLATRPWTRLACVKMLAAMEDQFELYFAQPEARLLFESLRREFEPDYRIAVEHRAVLHASIDSIYSRLEGIAGSPLNDSFHFGQTLVNDYGRPYQEGTNTITGFTAHAADGRFSFAIRGELQQAHAAPAYDATVRQAIALMDDNPVQPARPVPSQTSFRLLDANASVQLFGHEVSVGKSEFWWGPGEGGAFALSNNAAPFYSFRINRVQPLNIPLLSRLLGPVRYEFFVGPLQGHSTPRGPWLQGQRVSFKPSPNFEFGVSRTIVFGGEGHVPVTLGSFWNSFTSFGNVPISVKFSRLDPGARYSTFDFSYRVPHFRDWLTLYTDSICHDDVSPLSAPRRAGFRPGILLSKVPKLPSLEFRAEAVYTDFPTSASHGGQFFFFENAYHDAYTNKQIILGDWIGRENKGGEAWLTYHLSQRNQIQVEYRRAKAASDFVPGGTTQNDFALRLVRTVQNVEYTGSVQWEFWKAPILATGLRQDVTISAQLTYYPKNWKLGK